MFKNNQKVKIKVSAGLPNRFKAGIVVGVITTPICGIGCVYAIDVGELVSEEYPYKIVAIAEIHLEEEV